MSSDDLVLTKNSIFSLVIFPSSSLSALSSHVNIELIHLVSRRKGSPTNKYISNQCDAENNYITNFGTLLMYRGCYKTGDKFNSTRKESIKSITSRMINN